MFDFFQNVTLTDEQVFSIAKVTSVFYMATFAFGIFGNLMIVAATIRSKQLHNTCNVLIACQAVSDLLLGVGHPPYTYYAYTETRIPFSECYYIQVVAFSAMNTSTILIFFIGIDRVMSVKYAVFYKALDPRFYVTGVVTVSMIYCNGLNLLAYFTLTDELTVCLVPEAYTGLGKNVAFGSHLMFNVLVLITYKYLNSMMATVQSVAAVKMIKSLRTVVICTVFGWFITFLMCNTAITFSSDKNILLAADMIAGFFATTHVAIPFIIYYMRSTLYRREFQRIIRVPILPKIRSSTITGISQIGSTALTRSEGKIYTIRLSTTS
ncbi:hypothetical protein QR680_019052 [Steinernema hermaphroditum]|uniref:G-protein coupled receptors family 1 profile domain-containing protein n=1 Tax=Steinernema hermaphroditum TaxID=289476 RepID=A0AA39HM39_9BILA|nr:hypothetical protein QR680_019052 [Steinernema hermaphroditum]